MRALMGLVVFIFLAAFVVGVTLAQATTPGDKTVDQPVDGTTPRAGGDDDPEEEDLPDPPPFFGEDGNAGEKMKIVWCLDRSGSMATNAGSYTGGDGQPTTGSRWDRAVSETTIALSQLTPEWQFGIVTYACNRDKFNPELVDAEPARVQAAIAWLAGHFPWGGTGTGPGQAEAFRLADGGVEGSATCWLLSDGRPNCGATGTRGHKQVALAANSQGHVLNTVGIADSGIFAAFMMELASEGNGVYVHVQ